MMIIIIIIMMMMMMVGYIVMYNDVILYTYIIRNIGAGADLTGEKKYVLYSVILRNGQSTPSWVLYSFISSPWEWLNDYHHHFVWACEVYACSSY